MTGSPPAKAYHELVARVLPQARAQRTWRSDDGPLPALFISHGAPPTLDHPLWLNDLYAWGRSFPKPCGIVVVSAHWDSAPLAISNPAAGTPLYYDFGGFDRHYYTLPYATPDATALARRVTGAAADTTEVHQHPRRGLDHGAFIPLMAMYPAADVPVVQLSMPSLDPKALFDLGQRLRPLREEGILVIGSGFMTHSFEAARNPALAGHTRAFDVWAADALARGDVDALIDYRGKAPSADIAHPTADHFVPLLLTLGAAANPGATVTTRVERMFSNNSTRSVQIGGG
ncbi:class III extradiol ring-cleavage dioxygenase [Amycolatopsis carbonis]|uniref:Class III extradiol ring-cleavage dioxygenase n=1 Tax=Amycolatopsis carbonis TaxID=715471 RepID=A0A9Y2N235_9PSEU|nr:class III extradiol ring-cleavage dioxygenase [Amycolatopsis sp. 2-15]WIX83619.1 class III extradiol ring-cleavage dioxygenase [Amycolatopsis sp. 2-15]